MWVDPSVPPRNEKRACGTERRLSIFSFFVAHFPQFYHKIVLNFSHCKKFVSAGMEDLWLLSAIFDDELANKIKGSSTVSRTNSSRYTSINVASMEDEVNQKPFWLFEKNFRF